MRYIVAKLAHPQYANQLLPLLVDRENNYTPEPSAAIWGWNMWLSQKYNTCMSRLTDLCVFYEFVQQELPSFFEDAATLKLLNTRQLNALVSFLLINFNYDIDDHVSVSPSTFNRRLDSIKKFLEFHYNRYIERINDIDKASAYSKQLTSMVKKLGKYRYSSADVENNTKYTEPLGQDEIEIIKNIIRPSSDTFLNEVNPFRKQLQVRNACIIMLLIELGCRASELILIRNNDSDLKLTINATIVIQNSKSATIRGRRDGASHKTRNRELPISPGLRDLLIEYIEEYRPLLRKPQNGELTDYLFISEKDGGPMTTSGLNYIMEALFKGVTNLKSVVHPHRFRVSRGIQLREAIDDDYKDINSPMIKAGDMQDTLTTWGGWSTTSTMTKRYTNAHLQRKINDYLAGKEA